MNPEYAQIITVFEFFSQDEKLSALFYMHEKNPVKSILTAMESPTFVKLGGKYREIGVNKNELWDWKGEQEKHGNILFWIKDKYREIYALSLPQRSAVYFYGLWKMSGWDEIKSSWK